MRHDDGFAYKMFAVMLVFISFLFIISFIADLEVDTPEVVPIE